MMSIVVTKHVNFIDHWQSLGDFVDLRHIPCWGLMLKSYFARQMSNWQLYCTIAVILTLSKVTLSKI